jgi:hypothetical protein
MISSLPKRLDLVKKLVSIGKFQYGLSPDYIDNLVAVSALVSSLVKSDRTIDTFFNLALLGTAGKTFLILR